MASDVQKLVKVVDQGSERPAFRDTDACGEAIGRSLDRARARLNLTKLERTRIRAYG
jgi:hypothetical protein